MPDGTLIFTPKKKGTLVFTPKPVADGPPAPSRPPIIEMTSPAHVPFNDQDITA